MEKEKILTVSIAAYNVEKYLRETLESLVNSDAVDLLDVIIVNDGSSDTTAQIAAEYAEKYPDSFNLVNKENGGYGSTINCSLQHAKGKYIKLLDGDDWYETESLHKYLQCLRETDADMVLTQYRIFEQDAEHPKELRSPAYTLNELMDIKNLKDISMHSMAVKTELVKHTITITEHCLYTDVEWFIRAALCCKSFIAFPVCVYCHRRGREGQSISDEGYRKHLAEHEYISKTTAFLIKENPSLQGLKKSETTILQMTFRYLLKSKRTRANRKKLFEFRKFMKQNAGYVAQYMETKLRYVYKCPILIFFSDAFIDALYRMAGGIKTVIKGR